MLKPFELLPALGLCCALVVGCNADDGEEPAEDAGEVSVTGELSYWDDVVPILERSCLHCHQEGGIAPTRYDTYEETATWSRQIAEATELGIMPPWYATHDGSCGEFSNTNELSALEVATLGAWHEQGAPEGERGDRTIQLPELPTIDDPVEYTTPLIAPEIQGGALAEFDEYRCYPLDPASEEIEFITAYDVKPGNPALVHHVIAYIVDPEAASQEAGLSNGDVMQALDSESPDREGWPCFADAGDGINMGAAVVTWAPGQGMVEFPGDSGVALFPTHKLVVQVHYNMADESVRGQEDQTTLQFRVAGIVPNAGTMIAEDELLASLYEEEPITLPPGRAEVDQVWRKSFSEMLGTGFSSFEVWGFMPHMHELGTRYRLSILEGGRSSCGVEIQNWDFNWQRAYFLKVPYELTPEDQVEVSCTYDTRSRTEPVLPGWGTQNEMCTGVMYVTVPLL